jgi:FimV-like protein
MEQESALNAKQRFDAHMKAPKQDFPRITPVLPQVIDVISEPAGVPAKPETVIEDPKDAKLEQASTVVQDVIVSSDTQTDKQPVKQEPIDPLVTPAPQVVSIITPEVTELLEKITSLESKLDAMDSKVEAIRSEAKESRQVPQLLSQVQPEKAPTEFNLEEWLPTQEQVDAFLATELGKGVLIFVAVVGLTWIGLRIFGRKEPMQTASNQASSMPPIAPAASAQPLSIAEEIQPTSSEVGSEALESAIERLKSKIEDPAKLQEAEELYSAGDDSLIDVFSADALNQNPEWGEDPDDEADVAAHQLELAQNYLDMGMTQTAIELLQRVSISPDQVSAEKARAALDAHQS